MDLVIFFLVVVFAVVLLLWLITKLPPQANDIRWILQLAVVVLAILAVCIRVFPLIGIDF